MDNLFHTLKNSSCSDNLSITPLIQQAFCRVIRLYNFGPFFVGVLVLGAKLKKEKKEDNTQDVVDKRFYVCGRLPTSCVIEI